MSTLQLSIVQPFSSPTWGSNLAIFSSDTGVPIPEEETKEYIAKASRYAKKYNVHLVPERFIMMGNQGMVLIGPDGGVIGAQQGIFENPAFPVSTKGDQINVWSTPFGEIFLAVDVDIYRPEIAKIAYNMGANIIIASQHLSDVQFSNHRIVSGVWNMAQSNRLFVVGVCNKYHCVAAPKEITKRGDGFYVAPTRKMPVTAKLNISQVLELPAKPVLSRKFYVKHADDLIEPRMTDEKKDKDNPSL